MSCWNSSAGFDTIFEELLQKKRNSTVVAAEMGGLVISALGAGEEPVKVVVSVPVVLRTNKILDEA